MRSQTYNRLKFVLFLIYNLAVLTGVRGQSTLPTADLQAAKNIEINKLYHFEHSPKGYGKIQEFRKDSRRSTAYFKEERNSMWLVMDAPMNGELSFEIIPISNIDDYDWMLFDYTSDLKAQLQAGTAQLLRSNNSRNDQSINGKTGIKHSYSNLFEGPGPGKSYSKSITVKKGQKLALLIDNIYDAGSGFDFISVLKPTILAYRKLSGTVIDKSSMLPLAATLICEDDSTGVEISTITIGSGGSYSTSIPADRPLNITVETPNYIFQTKDLPAAQKDTVLNFEMLKATDIENLMLFNIHFAPDRDIINSSSKPELERLTDLLKNEPRWEVRVIGHTNSNPFADNRYLQKLSFNRALSVKKYLTERGISEKRISSVGMGGKQPLIVTKDVEEGLVNLRVEVVVRRK